MGKLNGIIRLEGSFDGLTFYKTKDGHFVRKKGGVSKERLLHDPAFVRTRENVNEFTLNAASGKLLRRALGPLLHKAKDSRLSSRMLQLMHQLKEYDHLSPRGQRHVGQGLADAQAKLLLKGFAFNQHSSLESVLGAVYTVDLITGTVALPAFHPLEELRAPVGATHVRLRSAFACVDFVNGVFDTHYSPEILLPLSPIVSPVTLTPAMAPNGSGTKIHLLLVEFLQEVNGVLYSLYDGRFNALGIVGCE